MSPALAGSASTVQSPRHSRVFHFTSRYFRHLTSHHLTSSRNILSPSPPTKVNTQSLRTAPDTPPDRPRLTTAHSVPSPGHLAGAPRRGTRDKTLPPPVSALSHLPPSARLSCSAPFAYQCWLLCPLPSAISAPSH